MRDVLVHLQLDHLRIDHQHAQLLRQCLVEQRDDHRVEADRLARAGRAGHEQMRHAREVGDDGVAVNVLAEGHREERRLLRERIGVDDVAQRDQLAALVRHFDAHRRRAADAFDADRFRLQREREIVAEVDDLRVLHAG